jgi:diguanylate cyclase (GGDEF)-like protein
MNKDRPFDPNETIVEHLQTHIEISPRQPHLVLFIGPDSGKRFKLKPGQMTIGRAPIADITIDDEWASRIHAIIEWNNEVIQVNDNGSTNGIYVDYRKVDSAILAQGMPLQIGHSVMKVDFKDDAELRLEENLLRNACIDGLTGIFNRQHFMKRATEDYSYARRNGLPVGLIMIDIDRFKLVNDTHGHQMGDFVLNKFATVINQLKRKEDIFARYGGEEFVIIPCGQIHADQMFGFCERIRQAIEMSEFRFGDTSIQITASFGFHTRKIMKNKKIEPQLTAMIKKADQALYNAKEKGRNRTEYLL